jgi:Patatin-like phospholipase
MLLAEDIASKAIERRNLPALQEVVEAWGQRFWHADADTQATALEQATLADPALARDLANALVWNQPPNDSSELALLAVDAARGPMEQQPEPAVFAGELDWEAWRRQPDLRRLQDLFRNNTLVRNAFARAVNAYPGQRHLKEIAAAASGEIRTHGARENEVRAVLQQYVLNRDRFQAGQQDAVFIAALRQYYEFREQVARAIEYRSTEAERLAEFAVSMWRAVPIDCWLWFKDTRKKLLSRLRPGSQLQPVREALQGSAQQEPNDAGWKALEAQLAGLFARDPNLSRALWEVMDWPRPFALVLREELQQIESKRQLSQLAGERQEPQLAATAMDASDLAAHKKLFGVAFSGGGIRSATFNLGVLQKLSDFGLLGKVDYLSTVSGGGYIGAFLAAWIRKNNYLPFDDLLPKLKDLLSPQCPDPRADGQKPIRFLREFSNYLTPRLGSFSFDTWTLAAVYTRNLVLNQATILAVLGTALLLPRLLIFPVVIKMPHDNWMGWVAATALLLAVVFMSLNMRNALARTVSNPGKVSRWVNSRVPHWLYETLWVQVLVVVEILLAVYLGSLWIWRHLTQLETKTGHVSLAALVCAAFLSCLLSWLGGFVQRFRHRQSGSEWWWLVLALVTVLTAGASMGLLRLYLIVMQWLQASPAGAWHAEVWGPILLLTVLVIPTTLQVGLMGVDFPDPGREWLSRFRAVCSIYATYWIALMSAAIYGPLLILKLTAWSVKGYKVWISGLTLGWVVTTIGGLVAGNSKVTGTDKDGNPTFSWVQVLARVGPPVFMVGLILLIATGEQLLLAQGKIKPYNLCTLIQKHWTILEPWPRSGYLDPTGWLFVVLAAAGAVLAWRVDINEFSMHHFYKNRLVRCYLGASSEARRPNPFTGFDSRDDFSLAALRAKVPGGGTPYLGPYPIVNATLNLSVGKELAWQERKGTSFIFTPCFCGFDVQGWANATGSTAGRPRNDGPKCGLREILKPHGYRTTGSYTQKDGPLLGTAMAISGAAANPNQGYNTSPAVSFLMTIFDVRLGWWLGNPRRDATSKLSSPRFGLAALVSELTGSTDDQTRFVNLSDGGHFDNMGLYELVRRRCSFILLCDAEQDEDYKFEGLGSAIRKCRVDFGARIEINPVRIKPQADAKYSESPCAVGKIEYLDGSKGTLLYIKASLTGDEPEDVLQFHAAQPHFPHETTADQWFGESQFESYRALGYHATHNALSPATGWLEWDPLHPDVTQLFPALVDYWYPLNPNLKDAASKHTSTLADLFERIRQNDKLHALGAELFPGGTPAVATDDGRRATNEFYFGMCVIQLMEDLYFDLQLDRKEWFHDPRIAGWRFLFQRWKAVPAVAAAWAAERDAFRKDFQLFWKSL